RQAVPASTRSSTSIAAREPRPGPTSTEHAHELHADPDRIPRRADGPDLRARARALPGRALVRGAGAALLDRLRAAVVHLAARRRPRGVGRLGDPAGRARKSGG